MTQKLIGKVALVTGASAGIGKACALALVAEGAKVVLVARRKDRLDELIAQIQASGGQALAVVGDARDEQTALNAVAGSLEKFGKIDILIVLPGFGFGGGRKDGLWKL